MIDPDPVAAMEEIYERVGALEDAFAALCRSDTLFPSSRRPSDEIALVRNWLDRYSDR